MYWFSPLKTLHLWAYVPLRGARMLVFTIQNTLYVPPPWALRPSTGRPPVLVFPIENTLYVSPSVGLRPAPGRPHAGFHH